MPQLLFKGTKKEDIKNISKILVDKLQEAIGCPRDYFLLEVSSNEFICDGVEVESYPIVEVKWFDRGQELRDKVAKIITKEVSSAGYSMVDVIFFKLEKDSYYENGEHF